VGLNRKGEKKGFLDKVRGKKKKRGDLQSPQPAKPDKNLNEQKRRGVCKKKGVRKKKTAFFGNSKKTGGGKRQSEKKREKTTNPWGSVKA